MQLAALAANHRLFGRVGAQAVPTSFWGGTTLAVLSRTTFQALFDEIRDNALVYQQPDFLKLKRTKIQFFGWGFVPDPLNNDPQTPKSDGGVEFPTPFPLDAFRVSILSRTTFWNVPAPMGSNNGKSSPSHFQ